MGLNMAATPFTVLRNRLFPTSIAPAALFVLALGCMVSAGLFAGGRYLEHARLDLRFQDQANLRMIALRDDLNNAVEELETINQLFVTAGPVSRAQFHNFVKASLKHHPAILAVAYQRLLTHAERPGYERAMRELYPDFEITQIIDGRPRLAPESAHYRVIDYIEPIAANQSTLGLNVAPIEAQMEAAVNARDTGQQSATKLFRRGREKTGERSFLVMMPVYQPGVRVDDVASRRRALLGYTTVVFQMGPTIAAILRSSGFLRNTDIDVSVYFGAQVDPANLVYRHGDPPPGPAAPSLLPAWLLQNQPTTTELTFNVANQAWHAVVSIESSSLIHSQSGALLVLVLALMLTMLAAGFTQFLVARTHRTQQLVDARTAELRYSNAKMAEDIAARSQAEHSLLLMQGAIEASANAIFICSAAAPRYVLEYVNPAFQHMTGYGAQKALGRNCAFLWGADGDQAGIKEIRATVREQREGHVVLRNYRKDGTLFWSEVYIAPVRGDSGEVSHYVVALYDITATKRYEAELEFQANRDTLTGLANRSLLSDRLGQAIVYAARDGHPLWIAFVDLDRFKFVNDSLGHAAGDLLLRTMAQRLTAESGDASTVARIGGDEFVLILPNGLDEYAASVALQRMLEAVAAPVHIEGHELFLTCSIGIAAYPADGADPETLIKHADIAMYRAKETGRNNVQFYKAAMNERALERLRIEGDLRNAIEREEFVLHYQPQIDLRTGQIVGMEALIRWNHPTLGLLAPLRFIGLAEETGLIVPIGAWVLRSACRQNKAWQDAGMAPLRVAVNLSARQFAQQDLLPSIAGALAETGLHARYLDIELTESMVMADVEHAVSVLRGLKQMGIHLSIDDFGTGYSSLSYLKRFPIDVLKIDQSFVRDITNDPDDAAITLSIISLAHSLRLKVVAEGVETEAQLNYLRRHGCDQMQGYYFSPPVAAEPFLELLLQRKTLPPLPGDSPLLETLLIVDDESNVVTALKRLMRPDGYRILTALTPDEGFRLLALHRVQVIICDQRMPLMRGTEFLNKVRQLHPHTIRIVLSGYTALESVIDAINEGQIYRFFTKPWDDDIVRKTVRGAFQQYALVHEAARAAQPGAVGIDAA